MEKLLRAAPAIPILVVGAHDNEEIARQVIRAGAHDYLLTNRLDSYWLPRALRHAIERKLSEEAFLAEAQRVEVALNSIGDALLNTDISGRVTYLNRTAEAMTGWSIAEAAGRPLEEVFQIVDGATREPIADLAERANPGKRFLLQWSATHRFCEKHNPEVVIFDLSPPYDENWQFFKVMRDANVMTGRGIVLTTTNKNRLDEVLGEDSYALEVVGRPLDLQQIHAAIQAETHRAEQIRLGATPLPRPVGRPANQLRGPA